MLSCPRRFNPPLFIPVLASAALAGLLTSPQPPDGNPNQRCFPSASPQKWLAGSYVGSTVLKNRKGRGPLPDFLLLGNKLNVAFLSRCLRCTFDSPQCKHGKEGLPLQCCLQVRFFLCVLPGFTVHFKTKAAGSFKCD